MVTVSMVIPVTLTTRCTVKMEETQGIWVSIKTCQKYVFIKTIASFFHTVSITIMYLFSWFTTRSAKPAPSSGINDSLSTSSNKSTARYVVKHQNAVHVHKCKKCNKIFNMKKSFKMHLRTVHNTYENNNQAKKRKYKEFQMLKVMGTNVAGLQSKMTSLNKVLSDIEPSIIFLQETKMKFPGKIKTQKDYIFFELLRQNKKISGGGLALGIHKGLNAYGPQNEEKNLN